MDEAIQNYGAETLEIRNRVRAFIPDLEQSEQNREAAQDEVDQKIEAAMEDTDPKALADFLKNYIDHYPTLGQALYQFLYRQNSELNNTYTDYTLTKRKDGKKSQIGSYRLFYKEKILAELDALQQEADGSADPELEFCLRNWEEYRKKKGCQLGNDAHRVRNLLFCLAFALKMDTMTVSQILQKNLLMQSFNPKNPREAIYYYCLEKKISYQKMREEYLKVYNSEAFDAAMSKEYVNKSTSELDEELYQLTQLENGDFLAYLRHLKWLEKNAAKRNLQRTTLMNIFRDHFWNFPHKLYTAPEPITSEYLTKEELWGDLWPMIHTEVGDPAQYTEFTQIYQVICLEKEAREKERQEKKRLKREQQKKAQWEKELQEKGPLTEEELAKEHQKRAAEEKQKAEKKAKSQAKREEKRNDPEAQEKKENEISEETYFRRILTSILNKSRINYYRAANQQELLPPDTLAQIFSGLDFTESIIISRTAGATPPERNELIAALFISYLNDDLSNPKTYFKETWKEKNPRKRTLEHLAQMVTSDLAEWGMMGFYERNPFELFLALCFRYEDPFAYFMASWESARMEKARQNAK
ncbi:MAG: hypothetical protein J6J12_03925 [Oscillospiraceae bacterium]|nr:hypothetical protein [Oscillospiraceae bacterium]